MQTELEAKWLDIDHDEFRKKLIQLGAKPVRPKTDMTRVVFDPPGCDSTYEWARVRDEGDRITMSYKRTDNRGLTGTKEVCLVVDSFAVAVDFLLATGFRQKAFQETRRETWELDGAEIDLDEWPWLPPFVEIETETETAMLKIATKLDLKMSNAMYGAAGFVYERYYAVSIDDVNAWPEIKFLDTPEWLEKLKRNQDSTDRKTHRADQTRATS